MGARVLAANVWVGDVLHLAGTSPDSDAAEQITNEKAWAEDDGQSFPEGEPSESWKAAELDAYAADLGIDLGGAKTKAEKVGAIVAAADPA